MPKSKSALSLGPALPQSGDDITMTSTTEAVADRGSKVRTKPTSLKPMSTTLTDTVPTTTTKPLSLVPDVQPSTSAPLAQVDAVQRINETASISIDRDYLLQMKEVGFPIAWYIYLAMQVDIASGYQKASNHNFNSAYNEAFCNRWEIPLGDFLASLKPLLKKGMVETPAVQMTLSLFDLDNLPTD